MEQRNIGEQLKKEGNRNGNHKEGQRQGQRRYNIYGKPGHNIKTYKKDKKKGNLLK